MQAEMFRANVCNTPIRKWVLKENVSPNMHHNLEGGGVGTREVGTMSQFDQIVIITSLNHGITKDAIG